MKKSFKGFLACLLAVLLVVPVLGNVLAEADLQVESGVQAGETASRIPGTREGTLEAKNTASLDLSGIRNGRTFDAAAIEAGSEVQPTDIVTIMVELDAAPAADVMGDNLRAAGSYRQQLVDAQDVAVKQINADLGLNIQVIDHYSVLFNGFAFEGEYRLVAEIDAMDGLHAFVAPVFEEPELFNTTTQVGAIDAWELGYTGAGVSVAIIDTGCKVNHPAFSIDPDEVQFTRDDIASIIASGQLHGTGSTMNVNNVYVSGKIPFQWNYYYNHADAAHPGTSDHGTHVAGIAAGNGGEIQGVAKDAQICVMQVFQPSGGAPWSLILPALEDAAVLGVSAANLSLGSPCGVEMPYDPSYIAILDRCVAAGVNLAMAAGNDYDSSFNNAWGGNEGTPASYSNSGYALAADPDIGVVGSPSTWPHSLSVAAVSNTMSRFYYITVAGEDYGYSENEANEAQLREALGGQTVEYVMVPNYGTPEDFAQVDVSGKVALVSRGEINFVEKAANAEAAGAIACIVYNNQAASVNMVAYEGGHIPHVIISMEAGAALAAADPKEMYIGEELGIFPNPTGNMTTNFSSRGLTANMAMKPEITAPGGQIYSSTDPGISGTWYATWDGTSMATPHVCGGMAIITEYVENNFPDKTAGEKQALVDQILMSTATPILSDSGDYAPVHEQGAGLMNLTKATTTRAYLTVEGTMSNRPKLELGDDPEKTGEMTMTFTVHNFGDEEQVYSILPTVMLNEIARLGTMADGSPVYVYYGGTWNIAGDPGAMLLGDANLDGRVTIVDGILILRVALHLIELEGEQLDVNQDGTVDAEDAILAARIAMHLLDPMYTEGEPGYVDFDMPATVTVPAGETLEVTVNAALNDEIKAYIDAYYPSGTLVEGFIELIPESEEDVSLTVPFIKFYGDWNYPATIDRGYYYEDVQWNSNNYPNTIGYKKGGSIYGLGINPYVATEDLSYYLADRNAISPNSDGLMDTVNVAYTGLLRNANVRYVVLDADGNEIDVLSNLGFCRKGFWDTDTRTQLGVTEGMFPGGVNLAQYDEEDIIIRIEAKLDNDGAHNTNAASLEANENAIWDTPVHVDTTAPAVTNFAAANGTFNFDVTDDHYVAAVKVYTVNGENLGELVAEQGLFETERGVTTAIEIAGADNAYVIVADYAMNEQTYLWDGTTLTPVESVLPPAFDVPEVALYCYGKNYNTKAWASMSSLNIASASYGAGGGQDDGDYYCGTYTGEYVYAANATSLVRYDASNIDTWTDKTTVALSGCQTLTEMAYDRTTGTLYGVELAGDIYAINTTTGAATKVCEPEYGVVAMDFAPDGTCYIVDAYGYLCTMDITTGAETSEIGSYGVSPVNLQSGDFFPQCGTYVDGCFFWFAADNAVQYYADMHILALDVNSSDYRDLGSPGGGLYSLCLFNYRFEAPEASVDPVDFYDNFDGPFNWELIDADGDGNDWGTDYFAIGLYADGAKCAVSYSWNDVVLHPDNWMISPEFELGEGEKYLSFFTASANSPDGDIYEHFQVIVIPQGVTPENGTVVYEHTLDTNALTEHLVDLSDFAGQNISIAFRHYDCFDQYTLIIDAVGVGNLK